MDPPNHTVLVVDDDPSIRFLCRVNLELEGYEVREAGTLRQARAELAGGDVDVLLLDVHVGLEDGREFLAEVERDFSDIAVALLTGSVDPTRVASGSSQPVLAKPFTLDALSETVRALASRVAHARR